MTDFNQAFRQGMYPQNLDQYKHYLPGRYDINVQNKAIPNAHILVVDSRSRNHGINGVGIKEPNDYTTFFSEEYKDVISVELVNSDIPNSGYTIESHVGSLRFSENGNIYNITIDPGNYTATTLATAIQSKMNAVTRIPSGSFNFVVGVETSTNKMTIEEMSGTPKEFELIFNDGTENFGAGGAPSYAPWQDPKSVITQAGEQGTPSYEGQTESKLLKNSIAEVIGFARKTYSGAAQYTGEYSINLRVNRYIVLHIIGLNRLESQSSPIKDGFCVIALDDNSSNFRLNSDFDDIDNDSYTYYFPEPMPRLDRMRIKMYSMNGELYDFHGHDHLLTFKISTKNRTEKA